MRELFENRSAEDAIVAARRGSKVGLRRRFYSVAAAVPLPRGYAVQLDGKPVHTPARRTLAAPTLGVAETMAAEWQAQQDVIDPAKMPLTRLANAIIDGVAVVPFPVAEEIGKYVASDLLFYRAEHPAELRQRQAERWDPILDWARTALGADFTTTTGVIHIAQSGAALAAARSAIPTEPWRLGAVHSLTTLTGSALLALAVSRGHIAADAAWQAAHVDEDWNMEQWGRDPLALERRAFRYAELEAAATVLRYVESAG